MVASTFVHSVPIALRIENLSVVKEGGLFARPKAILQSISFDVQPGSFAAVVGPNGAGKTTLFRALVHERPTYGRVLIAQGPDHPFEDLYANPEYWLQQVGYVPVDNVLHEELTVWQALEHVAKLRLPSQSNAEIRANISEKIQKLGFAHQDERLNRTIKSLSSGERKKVNIAAELLTNPPLLLLDEPTSNLDPNAERDLMNALQSISGKQNNGNGPTILLITHTLETLDRCDYVVFIANAKLLAAGKPENVYESLQRELPAMTRQASSANTFETWAAIFDVYKTVETSKNVSLSPPQLPPLEIAVSRNRAHDSFWRQFRILFSRYFLSRYNDLNGVSATLWTGFIAGFLLLIAPSEIFLKSRDASSARQTVVLCVILSVIVAAFNSHREISKEFRIYIHERAKGLDPFAYLCAKIIWLYIVVSIFCTVILLALMGTPIARGLSLVFGGAILGVGTVATLTKRGWMSQFTSRQKVWRIGQFGLVSLPLIMAYFVQLQNKALPTNPPVGVASVEISILLTLVFTSLAALTAGLAVSASVGSNNDRATQLAIGVIIANVIMAFSALVDGTPEFRALFDALEPFTATHFGYQGFTNSISIYCWAGQFRFEEFNSLGHLIASWFYLAVHFVVALFLSAVLLRLQEKWTTRSRMLQAVFLKERLTWVIFALIICLMSWGGFLAEQSNAYARLTFYDRLYGADRYASIDTVQVASPIQQMIGNLSASACALRPVDVTYEESSIPVPLAGERQPNNED